MRNLESIADFDHDRQNRAETVDHALGLLEAVADTGPVSVEELAENLAIAPSTVDLLLGSLEMSGLVVHDPAASGYVVGPQLLALSAQTLEYVTTAQAALPIVEGLLELTDDAVAPALRSSWRRTPLAPA